MNGKRQLSQDEIAAFQRDGVAYVPAAVEDSWLREIDVVAEQQLNHPSQWANDANPGAKTDRMFTDRYLWRENERVDRFIRESGCAEIAAQAMQSKQIRFYFDHLLVKEPATTAPTPWHQDIPYWPFLGRQVCSVWLALTDTPLEGSSLEFVRGSHQDGNYYLPKLFGAREDHPSQWILDGEGVEVPDIDAHRDDFDIVSWDVKRGDALVFSAWILHGAPGNTQADKRRVAFSTRWLGDDAVWHPHEGADPTVDPDTVRVDAGRPPHDDEWFPLVVDKQAT